MTPEEFRKAGHAAVERIAEYYENVQKYNVLSQVEPGYLKKLLPEKAPEDSTPFSDIAADFEKHIMPGVTHWQHPSYFAYFPSNSSFEGILGDMYSDMVNCIGFSWITSPACTELETIVLDWMGKAMGLDVAFLSANSTVGSLGGGVIQGTASEAVVVCVVAAKNRMVERMRGLGQKVDPDALVAYGSTQTHSCTKKATLIAGCRFHAIETDSQGRLLGSSVKETIERDIKNGLVPFYITATFGTTGVGAIDDIGGIADAITGTDIWLHVDAAWAGATLILPEFSQHLKDINRANSYNVNMHKWLLCNFDCSLLWVKSSAALTGALSVTPEYLRNKASDSGGVIDYRDWQLPLGRRFRSLKIWFVIRSYGLAKMRDHVRKHINLASLFSNRLEQFPTLFRIVTPLSFALLTFQVLPEEHTASKESEGSVAALTKRVLESVNASGKVYLTHTITPSGQWVIRFVPGAVLTEAEHVNNAFELIHEHASVERSCFPSS